MIDAFMVTLAVFSLFVVIIVYGGLIYLLKALFVLWRLIGGRPYAISWDDIPTEKLPTFTIFIPARNEEGRIIERLNNLLSCDYPVEKIEIIVASDGSTDRTAEDAADWFQKNPAFSGQVKIFEENVGRAFAQNWAAGVAKGDIFLNTDVETRFEPNTLQEIAKPFQDAEIGAVGVQTIYRVLDSQGIGDMYASYRSMEYALRTIETKMGLCAKSDGPCTAVRTNLWTPIALFEDIDYAVPLMVKKANKRLVYNPQAIAYDVANSSASQEFKQRSRMTIRQLTSFAYHWNIGLSLKFPAFTFVFVCHKILRMISPFFILCLSLPYFWFGYRIGHLAEFVVVPALLLFVLIMLSLALKPCARIVGILKSLIIANLAFADGTIKAISGRKVQGYNPTRKI
ncbi:glycosyltransferase [Pannonibacter phragmitetus]|nr:glycosyltransferase [Pannonibacter phragmitetus]